MEPPQAGGLLVRARSYAPLGMTKTPTPTAGPPQQPRAAAAAGDSAPTTRSMR